MEAAYAMGIPPSVFRGRVVRPKDAVWTPVDKAEVLALIAEQKSVHTCGQPIAESFDPANQNAYKASAHVCHACKTIHHRASEIDDPAAVSLTVEKKETDD